MLRKFATGFYVPKLILPKSFSKKRFGPLPSTGIVPFLTDTFTEASSTALNAHTSDSGATWSGNANQATVGAGTGEVGGNSDAFTLYAAIASPTPGSADYYVEVNGKTGNTSARFGPIVRLVDTDNYYMAAIFSATDDLRLYENVAGSFTQLGSGYTIPSFSATTYYTIRLTVTGSTLSVKLDGVERINVTGETTFAAAGKAGLLFYNSAWRATSIEASL